MSGSAIENRVVSMSFDNQNFEKNANQSLQTIDKLNNSLKATENTEAFDKLDKSSKKLDFNSLATAVESVSSKFSTLGIIGVTALQNITNRVVDLGINMTKSLSVDQFTAGWDKYEQKTKAVQTIMAATAQTWEKTAERVQFTGTQMEFVEAQMEKLNWFSDETSYNFVDMVDNIGKFTSNGVELDVAANAMQGIATWAAISGQNAQAASRAMYNLSQAIGVGAVKVIDWKSIENANMATQEFKQTAIETAVQMGILKQKGKDVEGVWEIDTKAAQKLGLQLKKGEVSVNGFRDSLQSGWLSSEVLLKTLDKYGGAATKLNEVYDAFNENGSYTTSTIIKLAEAYKQGTLSTAEMQEISKMTGLTMKELTGYFDELTSAEMEFGLKAFKAAQEAKTLNDVIDATKDAVSTAWMNIFQTIFGNYEEAKVIWTDFANFLYNVFAEPLNNVNSILMLWRANMGRAFLFDKETGALYKLGGALSSIIKPAKEAWASLFPDTVTKEGKINFEWWAKKLKELSKGFSELVDRMKPSEKTSARMKSIFRGLFSVVDILRTAFQAIGRVLKEKLGPYLKILFDRIFGGTATLSEHIVKLRDYLKENDTLYKVLKKVADVIENVLIKAFRKVKEAITDFMNGIHGIGYEMAILDESGEPIKKYGTLFWKIGEIVGKVIGKIEELTGVSLHTEKVENYGSVWDRIKQKIEDVKTTISNLALVWDNFKSGLSGGEITLLPGEDGERFNKLSTALYTFGKKLGIVIGKIKEFGGKGVEKFKEVFNGKGIKVGNVLKLAIAIGIFKKVFDFVKARKEIGGLFKSIKKVFSAIPDVLDGVSGALEAFAFNLQTQSIKNIAISIGIITLSLLALSFVDWKKIAIGLGAVGVVVVELISALGILNDFAKVGGGFGGFITSITKGIALQSASKSLIMIAIAIGIVAAAIFALGKLELKEVAIGMLGVAAALIALLAAAAILSKLDLSKGAGQLFLIGAALLVMALAVKAFAKLKFEELAMGFVGMASSLLLVIAALAILSKLGVTQMVGVGLAIAGIGAAMLLIAIAVEKFGALNLNEFVTGFAGLAVAMGALVIAMQLLPVQTALGTSIAVIALAAAMLILQTAVARFGAIPTNELMQGMIAMAAGLIILCAALKLCQNGGLKGAAAILIMCIALNALVPVMQGLGALEWGEVVRGLAALAGALLILLVAAKFAQGMATGLLVLSAALIALGIGFSLFIPQFVKLGELGWDGVIAGLVGLAGTLGILTAAAAGAQALAVGFGILSVAMLALGVAALGVGEGMNLAVGAIERLVAIPDMALVVENLGFLALALGELSLAGLALISALPGLTGLNLALKGLAKHCANLAPNLPQVMASLLQLRDLSAVFQEVKGIGADIKEFAKGIKELGKSSKDASKAGEVLSSLALPLSQMSSSFSNANIAIASFIGTLGLLNSTSLAAQGSFTMLSAGILTLNNAVQTMKSDGMNDTVLTVTTSINLFGTSASVANTILAAFAITINSLSAAFMMARTEIDLFVVAITSVLTIAPLALAAFLTLEEGIGHLNSAVELMKTVGVITAFDGLSVSMTNFVESARIMVEGLSLVFVAMVEFITLKEEIDKAVPACKETIRKFLNDVLTLMKSYLPDMQDAGYDLIKAFATGISDGDQDVQDSAEGIAETAEEGLDTADGYSLGQDLGQGYADGILSKVDAVRRAAQKLAQAAEHAIKWAQDSNSPSKVAMKLGNYLSEGYALGISEASYMAEDATEEMMNSVLGTAAYLGQRIREKLEEESSPVITPVLDTSLIEAGTARLGSHFGGFNIPTSMQKAFMAGSAFGDSREIQNGSGNTTNSVNNYYTQNNYSPKALSRVEIYRQTKNLITAKKGAVRA